MVAIASTVTAIPVPATRESWVAHWKQVDRFDTVESAEARIHDLQAQGMEAVLSMIDGLCVLVRRD